MEYFDEEKVRRLLRWEFVRQREGALPDFFQLRIVDANRGEPVPIPLIAGARHETLESIRDLFACPFHRWKSLSLDADSGKVKGAL